MTSDPAQQQQKLMRFAMRLDLFTFVHRCFAELNPSLEFSRVPHLRIMAAKIAETLQGRGPKRLIVNLPPRSLKSITVSVAAVAWVLGHDPSKQIICASYGQELAEKHARDTRIIMQSKFYASLFPSTRLNPNRLSVNDFGTTRHGFRMATSVGGVLTGRGGNILIIDDPLKPEDALSDTRRQAVNDWFDNTLLSRLNSKEDGIIIIVMQRLHEDDLVGHVLDRGEEWDVLSFPAIAEDDEVHRAQTVFGPFEFKRSTGEVLDPKRESLNTLLTLKASIGTYNFSSQYQQKPTPKEGAIVKHEWLKRYEPDAPMPNFLYTLQSWDTANKSGELNDYSVCTTWGVAGFDYYLLHVYRARLDYPTLKRKVFELRDKWQPSKVLIEDKASGTQLIQDLRADGMYSVVPYEPEAVMDKIMRLHAQTDLLESGNVLFPRAAPWLDDYLSELTGFPNGKFDDQVDSTTQALDYLRRNRTISIWAKLAE